MSIGQMKKSVEQQDYQRNIRELTEYVQNMVEFGVEEWSADEKQKMDAEILAKLESGKKLTGKELRYLKRYNPILYAQAVRVEAKRKSVEERLKHARSKEKVEEIQDEALGSISEKDPARKYLVAAVLDSIKEFKKTASYQKLPETEENQKTGNSPSISYEFAEGFYQIAYAEEK